MAGSSWHASSFPDRPLANEGSSGTYIARERRGGRRLEGDTKRILIVEDNAGDADLVAEHFEDSYLDVELLVTPRLSSATAILREEPIDCVLLDLGLPDVRGTETVVRLREVAPDVPVVVLTGFDDAAIAGSCVRLGAQEYLEKGQLSPRSLAQAVELAMLRVSESRVRRELLQNDRLRSIGLLAAGIAHEVNNPLTVLHMNLQALQDWVTRQARDQSFRDIIEPILVDCQDGADRIARIVGRLNAFARADEEQPRTVLDVEQTIHDAVRLTTHQWRGHCELELDIQSLPKVFGYPGQLTQVLVNLLLNAAQAIGPVGRGLIRIETRMRDQMVEIQVIDDGPGMPPAVLRRVFDPFYTTKDRSQGTGLGLALCQGIIKGHGGSLTAVSTPGDGSTFTITLPPSDRDVTHEDARKRSIHPPRRRVLVVDDELPILKAVSRLLRNHHDVTVAQGGRAALDILSQGVDFDVVLCDHAMPDLDGSQVYRWLMTHRPSLVNRFVVMSGGVTEDVASTLSDVFQLGKPFQLTTLIEMIEEVAAVP